MFRNDTAMPFFALLLGAALGLMAYLDGQHIARLLGETPKDLSVGQIGLVAFALVLGLYGIVGLVSVWLEGTELRVGTHAPRASMPALLVAVLLALGLVVLSGLFVRSIRSSLVSNTVAPLEQGLLFGGMMLCAAAALAVYRKAFVAEEAIAEDERGDGFPW